MHITEKCDVYSFGVLILEIIKGDHPRDFVASFPSSTLTDVLDPRLVTPSRDDQDKLISIIEVAFSCGCQPKIQTHRADCLSTIMQLSLLFTRHLVEPMSVAPH